VPFRDMPIIAVACGPAGEAHPGMGAASFPGAACGLIHAIGRKRRAGTVQTPPARPGEAPG